MQVVPFDKIRKIFEKKVEKTFAEKKPKGGPFGLTCTFESINIFMV